MHYNMSKKCVNNINNMFKKCVNNIEFIIIIIVINNK